MEWVCLGYCSDTISCEFELEYGWTNSWPLRSRRLQTICMRLSYANVHETFHANRHPIIWLARQ